MCIEARAVVDMLKGLLGNRVIQRRPRPARSPHDMCCKSFRDYLKESECQKPASNTNSGKQPKFITSRLH
jgi:hypothetical protein